MKNSKVERIHRISLAANAIATLISIIILAYLKDFKYRQLLVLIIVILQLLSLVLDNFYQNGVVSEVFGSKAKKEELMRKADPDLYEYTIQGAREELRYGLKILMAVAAACFILFGLVTQEILKAIACLCALGIAFMYADYIPHVKFYSERYDAKSLDPKEDGIPNSLRGLAKIYLAEYRKNYNDNNAKNKFGKIKQVHFEFDKNDSNQDECIKNILRLGIDTSVNYFLIFSIIITTLTTLSIIPGVIDNIVAAFMINISVENSEIYPISLLVLNFVLFTVNYAGTFEIRNENEKIKSLAELICKDDAKEDRFKVYDDSFRKNRTILARGIFNYCASCMNQGKSLEGNDLSYKMLFAHRLDANRSRFWSTVVMSGLALLCLLIDFRVGWNYILVIGAIYIILSIAFRFLFLSRINKRKIIRSCEELKKEAEAAEKETNENKQ